MKEEKNDLNRKKLRVTRRRRITDEDDSNHKNLNGLSGFWVKWGKHSLQTTLFGLTIILICFVGQEPPGLRTLGEVAPENVYSDRSFSYLSEVRRLEAEEWIRSSTPREFNRDFVGEENFAKAMVRLREGMIAVSEISDDSKELALQSLTEEIRVKFQVLLSEKEAVAVLNATLMHGDEFFKLGNKLLSQLHLTGVVKFPSVDQKFLSESNASARIKSQMIELVNDFTVFNLDQNISPVPNLIAQYPVLSGFLQNIESNQSSSH